MVTIESAYYNDELWCAYELKNNEGKYKEDLRLMMRKESQCNKFTCPDCGEHLILCAGPIMEPYFKHHENSKCIIRSADGARRYNLGKRLLYQLAKRSFPEARISYNIKLSDKYRSGIFIENGQNKLSIEYLCSDLKYVEWEEKHQFLKENNINDVWILSNNKYKEEHLQTFEYLILEKASPIIKILNQDSEKIILKQYLFVEESNNRQLTSFEYNLSELIIKADGEFDCDFITVCNRNAAAINERLKEERLAREEQERFEKEIRKRMEQEEHERWLKAKNMREQEAYYDLNYSQKAANVVQQFSKVKREKLDENTKLNNKKMKMTGIDEAWELPELSGKEGQVRNASRLRYLYLKEKDKELRQLQGDKRESKCCETIAYLEKKDKATDWIFGR